MEKASFDRLNRLFEIATAERSCEMLLSAQNLRSVMKEPQPYVLNILPRLGCLKKLFPGSILSFKICLSMWRCRRQMPRHAKPTLLTERIKENKGSCERHRVVKGPHLLRLALQRGKRRR